MKMSEGDFARRNSPARWGVKRNRRAAAQLRPRGRFVISVEFSEATFRCQTVPIRHLTEVWENHPATSSLCSTAAYRIKRLFPGKGRAPFAVPLPRRALSGYARPVRSKFSCRAREKLRAHVRSFAKKSAKTAVLA